MGVLLWLSIRGLRPSVVVQTALIVIEYVSVITFVILALIHEAGGSGGATLPSWSDFSLSSNIGGIHGLANAGVTCAVLYAGWEAVSVVGEESTKPRQNPGRAMIGSVAFLIVWFTGLIMPWLVLAATIVTALLVVIALLLAPSTVATLLVVITALLLTTSAVTSFLLIIITSLLLTVTAVDRIARVFGGARPERAEPMPSLGGLSNNDYDG